MMGLIIIVGIVFIVWMIGRSSSSTPSVYDKDYDQVKYHMDMDKEYMQWKMKGVDDYTAHANSVKKAQEDLKDGKYDK